MNRETLPILLFIASFLLIPAVGIVVRTVYRAEEAARAAEEYRRQVKFFESTLREELDIVRDGVEEMASLNAAGPQRGHSPADGVNAVLPAIAIRSSCPYCGRADVGVTVCPGCGAKR